MARKPPFDYEANPWLFRGVPFTREDVKHYVGFVYLITDLLNGRKYLGKKFFYSVLKVPGKTRRQRFDSDWKTYFGSNDELIARVKEHGPQNFKREILSVHELERDVNFNEVREQFVREVLETLMEDGTRLYYNANISGKYFPNLVIGWKDRSLHCE